jgi:hypothetical protein
MKAKTMPETLLPLIAFVIGGCIAIVFLLAWQGRLKDAVDASPPYLLGGGAIVSLVLVGILAWQNKTGPAGVLVALFVLCVALAYFPRLDSVKAFSVDIRLRRTLDRAEEILGRIKALSLLNGKATYAGMAWASRWGGMPIEEKQKIADQIDEQLKSYGATDADIAAIKEQYVALIGYDLVNYFEDALAQYVANANSTAKSSANVAWLDRFNATQRLNAENILASEPSAAGFLLKSQIPRDLVKPDDAAKFERFAERIAQLWSGCRTRGGYTNDAIDFFRDMTPLAGPPLVAYVLK